MKIEIRFDAADLTEALSAAAVESMPPGAFGVGAVVLLAAREDRYREALDSWLEDGRITVEFDTEAGTARVLRRDGKEEINGMLFTPAEAASIRERAGNLREAAKALRARYEADEPEGGAA